LRYLITGGAGFYWFSTLRAALDAAPCRLCSTNLSTGSVENIRHLKSSGNMHITSISIENRQLLAELVDDRRSRHLAALLASKLIVESRQDIETNVNGTQLVLEARLQEKEPSSLLPLRGLWQKHNVPFHEDADLVSPPTKGRWSYAASKRLMSSRSLLLKESSVLVVRLFHTVGPVKPAATAWCSPNFVKSALDTRHHDLRHRQQSRCFATCADTSKGYPPYGLERSVANIMSANEEIYHEDGAPSEGPHRHSSPSGTSPNARPMNQFET